MLAAAALQAQTECIELACIIVLRQRSSVAEGRFHTHLKTDQQQSQVRCRLQVTSLEHYDILITPSTEIRNIAAANRHSTFCTQQEAVRWHDFKSRAQMIYC